MMYSFRWATSSRGVGILSSLAFFLSCCSKRLSHTPTQWTQMCAIGLPVDAGISALPSIIGPASALFRPQKSHSTGGCAGDELSSVVTLVTPHRNRGPKQGRSRAGDQNGDTPQAYQRLRPEETRSCSSRSLVGLGDIVLKYKSSP